MDNITFQISIPLDEDGFLEMECDFCKNRFMLTKDTFEAENNLGFFCPICGLPNSINTFWCPEVLEKSYQIAANYALEKIKKQLSRPINQINRSGLIKIKMTTPKPIPVMKLYKPTNTYSKIKLTCCNIDVKASLLDEEIGVYCPICGGTKL